MFIADRKAENKHILKLLTAKLAKNGREGRKEEGRRHGGVEIAVELWEWPLRDEFFSRFTAGCGR